MEKKNGQLITGVWIPGEVSFNPQLKMNDFFIWWVISSFKKCFAQNAFFAKKFGISKTTVSRSIRRLKTLGYIKETGKDPRVLAIDPAYVRKYRHFIYEYQDLSRGEESPSPPKEKAVKKKRVAKEPKAEKKRAVEGFA